MNIVILSLVIAAVHTQNTDDEDLITETSGDFGTYDNIESSGDFDEVTAVLSQPDERYNEPTDLISDLRNESRNDQIEKEPKLFIAITLGVACLCCLTLIILLGCHRFKKKDEGSYDISYHQGEKKAYP